MSNRKYIFLSFIVALGLSRLAVYIVDLTKILFPTQHIGSFRIHHVTYGLILLIVAGYVSLAFKRTPKLSKIVSLTYGAGLALVVDEIWVTLKVQSQFWSSDIGYAYYEWPTYLILMVTSLALGAIIFIKKSS